MPRTAPRRTTRIIGERFYIYAARMWAGVGGASDGIQPGDAPTGVIVGTATMTRCVREDGHYQCHLAEVNRIDQGH